MENVFRELNHKRAKAKITKNQSLQWFRQDVKHPSLNSCSTIDGFGELCGSSPVHVLFCRKRITKVVN
jgi:hypothetical protein